MAFDFVGAATTISGSGTISGTTTQPGVSFTFTHTGSATVTFDGTNFSFAGGTFAGTFALTVAASVSFTGLTLAGTTTLSTYSSSVSPGGSFVTYVFSGPGAGSITGYSATCFCAGTLLATPQGPRAVETLAPGDALVVADGGTTTVQWLGRQIMSTRFQHPAQINPICISAGALGNGLPRRDLLVSPDHGIAIDGFLINANALVNGDTIYQIAKMPLEGFSYYHVETDTHELILAEGCQTESYLDIPNREMFVNADERAGVPPITEMDMPRLTSRRLLPEPIKQSLGIAETLDGEISVNLASRSAA